VWLDNAAYAAAGIPNFSTIQRSIDRNKPWPIARAARLLCDLFHATRLSVGAHRRVPPFSVPSNDGVGSDDDKSLFPVSPEPGQDNPEESIRSSELPPSMMSAKEGELLSQREILEC
jgi:hypothetical protein